LLCIFYFDRIFPISPSIEDYNFTQNVKKLFDLSPELFNINPDYRHEEVWKLSIKSKSLNSIIIIELQKVEKKMTPKEKLCCFQNAYILIRGSIDIFSNRQDISAIEDIKQILSYLFVHSFPTQLNSDIKY